MTARPNITETIKSITLALLEESPDGLRYSQLHAKISAAESSHEANTINASIGNHDQLFPDRVFKPSKGLFRLLKHKPDDSAEPDLPSEMIEPPARSRNQTTTSLSPAVWRTK